MVLTKYYFVVASKQFLVTEEPLEEVLRERIQYYCRTKKRIDFWLLPAPKFLEAENFKNLKNKFPKNCLAIVSTNKIFITWLKLRLNNVFVGEFSGPSEQIQNPLDFESI
jgi:Protein of unknown function (DUF2488)